jgi:S1-C subfamily serine protease
VFRVLEGSPAASAGLREGDILTAVDGRPATRFRLEQVRQMFRKGGRQYLLSVKRGTKLLSLKITLKELI